MHNFKITTTTTNIITVIVVVVVVTTTTTTTMATTTKRLFPSRDLHAQSADACVMRISPII